MPELNEENYLDQLLNTLGKEEASPASNPEETVQTDTEDAAGPVDHERQGEPETVVQADALPGDQEPPSLNPEDLAPVHEPDLPDLALSETDLQRLESMALDDLIEDVTSETVSVADLFGGQSPGDDEAVIKVNTENTENVPAAEEQSTAEPAEAEVQPAKPASAAGPDVSAQEALAATETESPKEKKHKDRKKKKNFFGMLKNVFFESLEEENAPPVELRKTEQAGEPESHQEKQPADLPTKTVSDEPEKLDENEQLLKEMYGDGKEEQPLDQMAAPKKGFFARLKFRFAQMKKKNEEEDRIEQEAEEQELAEKQKKKEEKQSAAEEKKAAVKEQKAAKKQQKPQKEKKEKKEKKPKPAPKPGDVLKFKPKSMLLFITFVAGIIVLITVLNMGVHYNAAVGNAKAYMENRNYEKAYEALSGVKLNKKDEMLYKQSSVIMYVERQYVSCQNYLKMGLRTEALNALVKGIERYDAYYNEAKELGVGDRVTEVKNSIVQALQENFRVSEAEARSLAGMSNENFTQYYQKIEAYGKAKG